MQNIIEKNSRSPIHAPPSKQHATAGPYSPVLEITAGSIVVISGQAALDMQGNVNTLDFAEQTRITLANCLKQLNAAGCDFGYVFKVNVFLTNLENWPTFNEVYAKTMVKPYPVRTAVQTELLSEFLVEVEMWAAKPAMGTR